MPFLRGATFRFLVPLAMVLAPVAAMAQAGTIHGTVTDTTGAVIPGASVHLANSVSGVDRTATTDGTGQFDIANVAFNTYQISATANGFDRFHQSLDVHSVVAVNITMVLHILAASSTVTVEADSGDLVENDPTFHTDVDRDMFIKVPLESQSSSLSSLVTATTPGVSADSNGLFHGMGDHASNSFSIDGQSETDQVSKVFSNQLPVSSVASIEVIDGAPPAEVYEVGRCGLHWSCAGEDDGLQSAQGTAGESSAVSVLTAVGVCPNLLFLPAGSGIRTGLHQDRGLCTLSSQGVSERP